MSAFKSDIEARDWERIHSVIKTATTAAVQRTLEAVIMAVRTTKIGWQHDVREVLDELEADLVEALADERKAHDS